MTEALTPEPPKHAATGTVRLAARRVRLLDTALQQAGFVRGGEEDEEVVIDFREQTQLEALAEQAKVLYDQGKLEKEIATDLGVSRNLAAEALSHWFTSRGLQKPDGRTRRSGLEVQHLIQPLFRRLSPEVGRLAGNGLLLQDIAVQLRCDRNTVAQSLAYWRESQGLPPLDGRTRRKELAS